VEGMLRNKQIAKFSKKTMNKRGVSPLIATVLLIAFAVALGAVVMNWGRTYTEQTADNVKKQSDVQVKCFQDVKIKLLEINDKPKLCYGVWGDNSYINATLLNDGSKAIESMNLQIIGDSFIQSNTSVTDSDIEVSGAAKISVPYKYSEVGPLLKVRIIPVAEISGINTACSGTGSVLEKDVSTITECNSS
jgi:flagellin-like protein